MQGRRSFILSAGTLASLGSIGTVSAASQSQQRSLKTVNETVHTAALENGAEGAEAALEDLGSNATTEQIEIRDDETAEGHESNLDDSSDPVITPDYVYGDPDESASALTVSSFPRTGRDNEIFVSMNMVLRSARHAVRNSWWAPDIIGIGFNERDWAPVREPLLNASEDHTARFTADNVDSDALAGTVNIRNHNRFIVSTSSLPDAIVTLSGQFRLRDNAVPTTLWGSYVHTFAPEPTGSIRGITGGIGGIEVETKTATSVAWSKAQPTNPENAL